MKKISLKMKVTLWFICFMTVLAIIAFAALFYEGSKAVSDTTQKTIIEAVNESADEIEFDDGEFEIDDDLEYLNNGVYIAIYDDRGSMLFGGLPKDVFESVQFSEGEMQSITEGENTWYVYDIAYLSGAKKIWIRGVMLSYGGIGTLNIMLKLIAVGIPLFIAAAAVGGYMIINRAFKPVREITNLADQIGSGGDLTKRIDIGEGNDEIYILCDAFNKMFDRLQQAFERERQFTSDASHELRTPVSVIISQCEYSVENDESIQKSKEALKSVLKQAKGMSALIAQLLMLSRADKGQLKLQKENINLSEITEMVTEQIKDMALKKQISVETDIEPNLYINGDETMLVRMLLNIMENGIKYGKENGHLYIRLYYSKGKIYGEVKDDGIGIDSKDMPKIWDRFFQANNSRNHAESGVGLGLSMVKYIAEAHDGEVQAESVLNEGTVFKFSFSIE